MRQSSLSKVAVGATMPGAPLTAEQRARVAANKAKAAAVKSAKEKNMKQSSMLSFFSPAVQVRCA